MIGSRVLQVLSHLHCEFHAWIRTTGDTPGFGAIVEALTEQLLQLQQIVFDTIVILPSKKQDRDACIRRSIGLGIDHHGRVLQVPRKGLEIAALGRRCGGVLNRRERLVIVLILMGRGVLADHLRCVIKLCAEPYLFME